MAASAPNFDNIRLGGPDGLRYPMELAPATFAVTTAPTYYTAAGAIPVAGGTYVINGAGALAMTLAAPTKAQDNMVLTIVAGTAHAHTVTTPANKINGADDTVTYAAIGDSVVLRAINGIWMAISLGGPTPAILSEV
jgi:hypothetical protein